MNDTTEKGLMRTEVLEALASLPDITQVRNIQPVWERDTVHAKLKALAGVEQVSWFLFALGAKFVRDNGYFNDVSEDWPSYCENILQKRTGYVENAIRRLEWVQKNVQRFEVVPPYKITGLVLQYNDAFTEHPQLIDLVFVRGVKDKSTIMGEIIRLKGRDYVAHRQALSLYKTYGISVNEKKEGMSPAAASLEYLLERITRLVKERWNEIGVSDRRTIWPKVESLLDAFGFDENSNDEEGKA